MSKAYAANKQLEKEKEQQAKKAQAQATPTKTTAAPKAEPAQQTSATNSAPKATQNTTSNTTQKSTASNNIVKPGAKRSADLAYLSSSASQKELKSEIKGPNYDPKTSVAPTRKTDNQSKAKQTEKKNPNSPEGIKSMYGVEPQGKSVAEHRYDEIPTLDNSNRIDWTSVADTSRKNARADVANPINAVVASHETRIDDPNVKKAADSTLRKSIESYQAPNPVEQFFAYNQKRNNSVNKNFGISGTIDPTEARYTPYTAEGYLEEYNSIPNYNILQRALDPLKSDSYARKQKMAGNAEQAQAVVARKALEEAGITEEEAKHYLEWNWLGGDTQGYDENGLPYDKEDPVYDKVANAINALGIHPIDVVNAYGQENLNATANFRSAKETPVSSSLTATAIKPAESSLGLGYNTLAYALGLPMESLPSISESIRSDVSENWNDAGKIAYGVLNAASDMTLARGISGGAGVPQAAASIMGLEKASDVMNKGIERGLTPGQIVLESVASGVTTAVTEAIPMGALDNIAKSGLASEGGKILAKDIAQKVGAIMISEGFQEMAEDVADAIADRIIAGDASELNAKVWELERNGVPHNMAMMQVWGDWLKGVAIDGISGALTGGIVGGAEVSTQALTGNYNPYGTTNTEQNAQYGNNFLPAIHQAFPNLNLEQNQQLPTINKNAKTDEELDDVYITALEAIEQNADNVDTVVDDAVDTLLSNGKITEAFSLESAFQEEVNVTGDLPNLDKAIDELGLNNTEQNVPTEETNLLAPEEANPSNVAESVGNLDANISGELTTLDTNLSNVNTNNNVNEQIPTVNNGIDTSYTSENITMDELQNNPDTSDIKERGYNETLVEKTDAPSELKSQFVENPMLYRELHNKDVAAAADQILNTKSTDEALSICSSMIQQKNPTAVPLAYNLSKTLVEQGRMSDAVTLTENLSQALTEAGQFSQAVTINMLNKDPVAAMTYMQKKIADMNRAGREKFGSKWTDFELTDAEMQAFENIDQGDSDAINELYASVWTRIAKDYPVKTWDKLLEMRRVFLLCNMRTTVRNLASNTAMLPMRWTAGRVTALLEAAYQRYNPDYVRTETIGFTSKKSREIARECRKQLYGELFDEGEGKYSDVEDAIRKAQVFKGTKFDEVLDKGATYITNKGIDATKTMLEVIDKNTGGAISKFMDITGIENIDSLLNVINNKTAHHDIKPSILETIRNFTYWTLGEFGDTPFVMANFEQKIASYCEVNGITNVEDIPQDAIALAVQEANKATFHDNSKISQAMQDFRKGLNNLTGSAKLGDLIMTFAKTPGNIGSRILEYSPVGFFYNLGRALSTNADVFGLNRDIAEIQEQIDNATTKAELLKAQSKLAKYQQQKSEALFAMQQSLTLLGQGVTGYLAFALGKLLRRLGFITGGLSDDKRLKKYQQNVMGMQENAIYPGDSSSYTIDFLQPVGTAVLMGVIYEESFNEQDDNFAQSLKHAGVAVGDAWLNSTPLKNVSDILDGYGTTTENVIDTLLGLPSSWIPAQVGAAARIEDTTMRNTYDATSPLKTTWNGMLAKTPFASKTLPASYDLWGRERQRQGSKEEAAVAQLLNPGTIQYSNPTEIDPDIQELYERTGDNKVLPHGAERSYRIGNETYKLDNVQNSEYQRIMGTTSYDLAEKYIKSDMWNESNDTAKIKALDAMYDFAEALAKREVLGVVPSTAQKMIDLYDSEGIEAVYNKITEDSDYKGYVSELGIEGNAKTKELYENVGKEGVDKYAEALNAAGQYGAKKIESDEFDAYNNGDMNTFNKKVQSRVALENAGVPSTETTQKYLEENGVNSVSGLKEAYDIVKQMPKGVDEYGNTTYRSLTQEMLDIYKAEGAKGLKEYNDAITEASIYGTYKITSDELRAYRSGDIDTFDNMVESRVMLEEAELPVNSTTKSYVEEYGEEAIPKLEELYQVVSTIPNGTDEYGNPKYKNLTSDMLKIYERDGVNGLEMYKDALEEASVYGLDDLTEDEWKTYRSGYGQEFDDLVKYRSILEENDLNNTALNRSYLQDYGEDIIPMLQDANAAITQIQSGVDKYGDEKYFSPTAKTIDIYRNYGRQGVETFADIYMKNDIDGDPSSRTLKDTVPYIASLDMSDAEKGYYLYQFLQPNKTTAKYVETPIAQGKQPDYAKLYQSYINNNTYRNAVRAYNS